MTNKTKSNIPGGSSPWDYYYKDKDMVKNREKLINNKEDISDTMLRNRSKTDKYKKIVLGETENAK